MTQADVLHKQQTIDPCQQSVTSHMSSNENIPLDEIDEI